MAWYKSRVCVKKGWKKNVRIIKIHGNGNKSDNTRPVVRRAAGAFRYCHFITEMASTDYDVPTRDSLKRIFASTILNSLPLHKVHNWWQSFMILPQIPLKWF